MKKFPEQLTGLFITQAHINTAQQLQQQWTALYQAIRAECSEKGQAPTVRCINTANRIDELLVKLCASPSADTPEVRALYAALHQYLAVVATELAQLHFTTATPALKNLQQQIPQQSQITLFGLNTSQALNKPAAPQLINGPEIDSPPMLHLPIDVIIYGITPYLSRRDLQHWLWSCKFFKASTPMLQALKNKPIDLNRIAAGSHHTLMCTPQGELYSWGDNERGQLGLGHEQNQNAPQLVTALAGKSIKSITCGRFHNLALCSDGSVYSWGQGRRGQLGLGHYDNSTTPQLVTVLVGKSIQSIACGGAYSIAVCSDGSVYTWGANTDGQLGLGHEQNQNTPQLVTALSGKSIQSIACGGAHSIAVCRDGAVYTWGANTDGQLGLGHEQNQNTPQLVIALSGKSIQNIACGASYNIALCDDGSAYAWGSNMLDQLGLVNDELRTNTPQLVTALSGKSIQSIACGFGHSIALCHDGSVYTWGNNARGQLGLGHHQDQNTPQLVTALDGKSIQGIVCREYYSIAVSHDDSVYIWGENGSEQLGPEHYREWATPQRLAIKQIPELANQENKNATPDQEQSKPDEQGNDHTRARPLM